MTNANISSISRAENDAALFQHLIEGLKEYAIFAMDLEGKITTWNLGVKRLLGYAEDDFVGRSFSVIFSEEDCKLNIPEAELNTARSSGKAEDERWHMRKDGTLFWASGLVTLMSEGGKPIGFTKIMRDQTQKKHFQEQLAEQANALAAANKELTNFAGVLSHDLNTPLQTVYGFAHILKEQSGLDAEAQESVSQIVAGTKRMLNLVDDLLQYTVVAKAEQAGKFVDTAALLLDVLSGLSSLITRQNASVQGVGLPTVWADETQLGRVFQNLIENGIKYAAPQRAPEIIISAKDAGTETIFSVKDNGIGIDESGIARLFTLFTRLQPDGEIPGRGIGLATCRKIVERFGGKMWVQSKVNEGTIFFFSVPHPPNEQKIYPCHPEPTANRVN